MYTINQIIDFCNNFTYNLRNNSFQIDVGKKICKYLNINDQTENFYCNIASPSLVDNDVIKYIDYDLDVKLLPDGTILQLDSKEYEYHRKKYAYSNRLDFVVKHVNERVKKMMKNGEFPFSKQKMYDYYNMFLELKEHQENKIITSK